MKRINNVFQKIVSDENLKEAILTVCNSHRWIRYPDKPNRTVVWLESNLEKCIQQLRQLIVEGFEPSPVTKKRRYDANAGKWRDIAEPKLWPDQCVHHALIQAIEPVMMRGMDKWCCGSIKERGAHYGIRAVKKWMNNDHGGTKWCAELDIRHFYDSLKPEMVMQRMKQLIKDYRALDLIWRVIKDGIQIGAYCSQWFANTFLQPLDHKLRETGIGVKHNIRYMDNFTLFSNRKRSLDKAIKAVEEWLNDHGLELKSNWQKFRVDKRMKKTDTHAEKMKRRLPNALGYRFGRDFILLRKHNLLRIIRQLKSFYFMRESGKFIPVKFAQGLLSRLGMLRHCNSVGIYKRFLKKHTQRQLKDVVREYKRKEMQRWNMILEASAAAA